MARCGGVLLQLSRDSLLAFYKENAPDVVENAEKMAKIDKMLTDAGTGGGPKHFKLVKKLTKKYGKGPEVTPVR